MVVGAGVNGMVCALLAALDGYEVLLLEASSELGGGVRTRELTLPGFRHDICSTVHPFGRSSPVLRDLELEAEGLQWSDPPVPLAHPLLGEPAVLLERDIGKTAEQLERPRTYAGVLARLCACWPALEPTVLGPVLSPPRPEALASLPLFGAATLPPAALLGRLLGRRGGALWAGLAGHSLLPMESLGSSAVAAVLAVQAHLGGWPSPRGGAAAIARALERKMERYSNLQVKLEHPVRSAADLPDARAVVFDLTPPQLLGLLGPLLAPRVRRSLARYRCGPGVFKIDYALDGPVPWSDPRVGLAGTVHIGGDLGEISTSERAVWLGHPSPRPFLVAAQPGLFDEHRAPTGKQTFWVTAHVPNGWEADLTEAIESQLERYAPGFRDRVLARSVWSPGRYQRYNANYAGGDILGGANTLWQMVARPRLALDPYYLGGRYHCCSAAVPPGGGIHGMGGYHAYRSAHRRILEPLR